MDPNRQKSMDRCLYCIINKFVNVCNDFFLTWNEFSREKCCFPSRYIPFRKYRYENVVQDLDHRPRPQVHYSDSLI